MGRLLIPNTTQVPNVLLDEVIPHLRSAPARVLLAIVRLTFGFGKATDRISLSQLAKRTRLSRRATINGVKALGDLVNVKRGAKGRGTNEYGLNLNVQNGNLLANSWGGGEQAFTSEQSRTSAEMGRKVVNKRAPSQTNISKPNIPTSNEAPVSSSKAKRKPSRPALDPRQLEAFDRFYKLYPRHEARADALKAWLKLDPDPDLTASIMAGVARYTNAVKDSEHKFIKYPGAWLNARRWEDEPTGGNGAEAQSAEQRQEWRRRTFVNAD